MNFIQNLFEDIINQNVSSSSIITVHVSFIAALIFEVYFYFAIPSASIHFLILFFLTCGAYGAICWVLYQLEYNPELREELKKSKEQSEKKEEEQKKEEEKKEEEKEEEKKEEDKKEEDKKEEEKKETLEEKKEK